MIFELVLELEFTRTILGYSIYYSREIGGEGYRGFRANSSQWVQRTREGVGMCPPAWFAKGLMGRFFGSSSSSSSYTRTMGRFWKFSTTILGVRYTTGLATYLGRSHCGTP